MNAFQRTTNTLLTASIASTLVLAPGLAAASSHDDVLQLALTAPEAAHASPDATSIAASSEVGVFQLGGTAGLALASGFTGFRVAATPQYTLLQLTPEMYMDIAGHVGAIFGSGETIIEVVPAARFRYLLNDQISFYGDGGLGVAFASLPSVTVPGVGEVGGGSQTWGIFRIAGGVQYRLTPTISLVGEPVGLNIYFGTGSSFMYSLAAGALFRL